MVALIVSYLVLAYLLAPRAIFRWASVFLPLKFQRTRTEEITFAFWISVFPLVLALLVAYATRRLVPGVRWLDYEEVFAASYSESIFKDNTKQFWNSIQQILPRQLEFLFLLYYPLVVVETFAFVGLVRKHGDWRNKCRLYAWFVQQVLLRTVSEWHVLLTDFNFPKSPKRKVAVDLLTDDDHLYQGDVAQYFIDDEGALSGIILVNSRRFDRAGYLRDKEKDPTVQAESYWRDIPSANNEVPTLYIPRDKVLNFNVRYPTIEPTPSETAVAATEELKKEGFDLEVETAVEPSQDPKSPK